MAKIEYVEDALKELLTLALWNDSILSWQDHTILTSLSSTLNKNNALTRKQGKLLLKILNRYQQSVQHIFDLTALLNNPKWRHDFRKLDLSMSVWVERDDEGSVWIAMKFPYHLLKEFEETIIIQSHGNAKNNRSRMQWDAEHRIRKLDLYDFNIMVIDEFVRRHNFVIDDTFVNTVGLIEEIWQQQDNLKPYSKLQDNRIVLVNAVSDAEAYFEKSITGNIYKDMFLAKGMGFTTRLDHTASNIVERIATDANTHFWVRTNAEFLQLYRAVDGVATVVLDRNTQDIIGWLEKFVSDAKQQGINTDDIRVCFREPKDSNIPLNEWIRKNNLGGKVDNAKLLIFRHSPSKWLFTNEVDVKLVGTNSYTPVNNVTANYWMQSHPCVCYISDIKPTKIRNKQIANL